MNFIKRYLLNIVEQGFRQYNENQCKAEESSYSERNKMTKIVADKEMSDSIRKFLYLLLDDTNWELQNYSIDEEYDCLRIRGNASELFRKHNVQQNGNILISKNYEEFYIELYSRSPNEIYLNYSCFRDSYIIDGIWNEIDNKLLERKLRKSKDGFKAFYDNVMVGTPAFRNSNLDDLLDSFEEDSEEPTSFEEDSEEPTCSR